LAVNPEILVQSEAADAALLNSAAEARAGLIWDIGCRVAYRAVTFRPVVAFFIGMMLCVTGTKLPDGVNTLLTTVGNANTFMVFVLLGLFFDVEGNSSERWCTVGKILLTRVVVGVSLSGLIWLLPGSIMQHSTKVLLSVCLTLPPPPVAMNYTIEFGYESAMAGLCINVGIIVSFAFMWGIYGMQSAGFL